MNIRKEWGAFALAAVMLLGVASPAVQWRSVGAAPKSISYESLTDKLEGGWMGALWANFTGLPSEFQYIGSPGADSQFEWVVSDVYCTDDDTSMEYTFLHMMEVYGANDITYADMPAEWIYHFQDYIWEGNYNARQLMLQGVLPPETGKAGFNATPEAIDAQIECEIFGMITPGMLENAYGRTKWWMAAVGDGDVLENAAFYAMLCSSAFFSDDIYASLDEVRSYFPNSTETAQVYDRVLSLYKSEPDWRAARQYLHGMYWNGYSLDCRINFAATLLALLYGGGDYEQTVKIGVLAGYDNDCNAATAATILGIMLGYDALPANLKAQSGTYYRNTNRPGLASNTIEEIAERIAAQAEEVILDAGGLKNGNEYVIYDVPFVPATSDEGYTRAVPSTDGSWSFEGMTAFYNPDYMNEEGRGTTRKGDYAEVRFEGDMVEIISSASINGGSFSITVDGKEYGTVSLRAEETFTAGKAIAMAYGQTLRKLRGLGEGEHVLRLTAQEDGKWHSIDHIRVKCTEDEYYASEGLNYARTAAATPICSVEAPLGTGAGGGGIGVIRDGMYWKSGDHSSGQYDTYLGKMTDGTNYPKDFEDYVGYMFDRTLVLNKLVFNEGGHWGTDGGWFNNGIMRVEVYTDGEWTEVETKVTPAYPADNGVSDGGGIYVFTFEGIRAEGIRLIGEAGGTCKIISCGELEVYGGAQ